MGRTAKLSVAARQVGVHTATLKRWIRGGHLKGWQVGPGRLWYVDLDSLDNLIVGVTPEGMVQEAKRSAFRAFANGG